MHKNKVEINSSDFNLLLEAKEPLVLLDVREREEYELTRLENSTLVPVMEVEDNLSLISSLRDSDEVPIVVICRSGGRSQMVTEMLYSEGFTNVLNLAGGINALSKLRTDVKAY